MKSRRDRLCLGMARPGKIPKTSEDNDEHRGGLSTHSMPRSVGTKEDEGS